jgi:epoxide hydrolase-like predicted phosphatase
VSEHRRSETGTADNLAVPVRAVFFDIGGVLEINPDTGWRGRWAARLAIAPEEFSRRLEPIWRDGSVGTATLEAVEARTAKALGLQRAATEAMMGDAWLEYVGTLNRELADYFVSLRPRLRTGIISNSFVGAREREQDAHGFGDMCDTIVYSHEVGYMKPDARIYRVACERLGVPCEQAVLLDDLQANVDGARAVGMTAITFTGNRGAIAHLDRLTGAEVPSTHGETGGGADSRQGGRR